MRATIGELEKLTGMSRTTLRYYDTEGRLDPERQENGYRLYTEKDVMSLVQIKQLNALGVELTRLPDAKSRTSCADIYQCLVEKEQQIEQEIDEMYQKMARLRLHVETFKDCVHSGTVVEEARMIGAYRIYYGSAETDHPDTAEVFKRWIAEVPYTYSTIRIPQKALLLPPRRPAARIPGSGCSAIRSGGSMKPSGSRWNTRLLQVHPGHHRNTGPGADSLHRSYALRPLSGGA